MTAKEKEAKKQEAIEQLKKYVKPGDTVYTVLRHVSASGMSRRLDVYAIKDNKPEYLTGWVANALEMRRYKNGLVIGGCGMDVGFAVVYELASTLFRDNFYCLGEHCPSNDHRNNPRRNFHSHDKHSDAGYALRHEWI